MKEGLTLCRHWQALLGFDRNLTHLDGHVVRLKRQGVTQPGFVEVIEGEGMPRFENHHLHGDLYVEYNVVLPTELGPHMRKSTFQSRETCPTV